MIVFKAIAKISLVKEEDFWKDNLNQILSRALVTISIDNLSFKSHFFGFTVFTILQPQTHGQPLLEKGLIGFKEYCYLNSSLWAQYDFFTCSK